MGKKVRNGIYTTGKESFRVSVLNKTVEIDAINEIDADPAFSLKAGCNTIISKEFFETLLDRELKHYFWSKE